MSSNPERVVCPTIRDIFLAALMEQQRGLWEILDDPFDVEDAWADLGGIENE